MKSFKFLLSFVLVFALVSFASVHAETGHDHSHNIADHQHSHNFIVLDPHNYFFVSEHQHSNHFAPNQTIIGSIITPEEELECALYGAHRMYISGNVHVYDKYTDDFLFAAFLWTCQCGEYIATEGHPGFGESIGRYVSTGEGWVFDGFGNLKADPAYIYYNDSSRLEGFRFYAA